MNELSHDEMSATDGGWFWVGMAWVAVGYVVSEILSGIDSAMTRDAR